MSAEQRAHWDQRYAEGGMAPVDGVGPYPLFAAHEHLFPTSGTALEVACGRGRGAVWLASRGMTVHAVDLSSVAVSLATEYARLCGVEDRCRFDVHDLDAGLPAGDLVDLVLCYLFREADIDSEMIERVRPGGLVAIAVLSEVGAGPGRFRAKAGELAEAFGSLDLVEAGEADGYAWLVGRRPSSV